MKPIFDNKIAIIKQMVMDLSKKGQLKRVPRVKISKKVEAAETSLWKEEIIIGEKLLYHWRNGEFSEEDIEAILAHEIGHIMDRHRKFASAWFHELITGSLYFILGLVLLFFGSIFSNLICVFCVFILLLVWLFFFPFVIRKMSVSVELEADKNASKLIGNSKLAYSIAKRFRFYPYKVIDAVNTWKLLLHYMRTPTFTERLQNLGFEIKGIKIEIQQIKKCLKNRRSSFDLK